MLNGLYVLSTRSLGMIYGARERERISQYVREVARPQTRESVLENPAVLQHVDVLLSGWGIPVIDESFLTAAPGLTAIFYGAGAVGHFVTPALIERGMTVVSAQELNAVPVAEYTLAMILLSLKHAFRLSRQARERKAGPGRDAAPGCFGSTVGLVSYGAIARLLRRHLKQFDLRVQVYDPYLTNEQAASEDVSLTTLDALFATSDVVSLHTPLLAETRGMITGAHLAAMKQDACFINTSRGAVVREEEMLDVLSDRPDLQAVLDVTTAEPPDVNSALYTLPNVLLTPHIAGSVSRECRRMGRHIADEVERYCRGEPLKSAIDFGQASRTSHRPHH